MNIVNCLFQPKTGKKHKTHKTIRSPNDHKDFFAFLKQEWHLVKEDIGNKSSPYMVSFEILWQSYFNFLYTNDYSIHKFSKVRFGRLLTYIGVKKIKRGKLNIFSIL